MCLRYLAVTALLAVAATPTIVVAAPETASGSGLDATLAALDGAVFDSFNRCEDPAQLREHAAYFAADVEFYHDTGGVTWNREDMIANTARYVCGKVTRKLVAGSLKVYPLRGFGALTQGVHTFCQDDSGRCEGAADFMMVWRQLDGQWQVTRVLSYGHRTLDTSQ